MDFCHINKIHKNEKNIWDLQNTVITISNNIDPWLEIFSKNGGDVVIGNDKTKIDLNVIEKNGEPELFLNGTRLKSFAYDNWFSNSNGYLIIKDPTESKKGVEIKDVFSINNNNYFSSMVSSGSYYTSLQQNISNVRLAAGQTPYTSFNIQPGKIELDASEITLGGNVLLSKDFIFGDQNNRKKIDFYVSETDSLPDFFVNGIRFGTGGSGESFKYANWFSGENSTLNIGNKSDGKILNLQAIYGGSYTASIGLDSYSKGAPSIELKAKGYNCNTTLALGSSQNITDLTTGMVTINDQNCTVNNDAGFCISSADNKQIQGAGVIGTEDGTWLRLANAEDAKEILLSEDGIQFYVGGTEKLNVTEYDGIQVKDALCITGNNSYISCDGTISVKETISAESDLEVGGDLTVSGVASIDGELTVFDSLNANQDLNVTENATFNGPATFNHSIVAQDKVTINNQLDISGEDGCLNIEGQGGLYINTPTYLQNSTINVDENLIIGTNKHTNKIDINVPVLNNLPELFINGKRYGNIDIINTGLINFNENLALQDESGKVAIALDNQEGIYAEVNNYSDKEYLERIVSKEYIIVCDIAGYEKPEGKIFSDMDLCTEITPGNETVYVVYKSYQYKHGKLHAKVILKFGDNYDFTSDEFLIDAPIYIPMHCLQLKKDTNLETKNLMNAHGIYVTDSYVDTQKDEYPYDAFLDEAGTAWERSFNYVFANVINHLGGDSGNYEDLTTALILKVHSSTTEYSFADMSAALNDTSVTIPTNLENEDDYNRKNILCFDFELPDEYELVNVQAHTLNN